jgi:hypothetical protein
MNKIKIIIKIVKVDQAVVDTLPCVPGLSSPDLPHQVNNEDPPIMPPSTLKKAFNLPPQKKNMK